MESTVPSPWRLSSPGGHDIGPVIWTQNRTCWLNNLSPHRHPVCTKLGTCSGPVNIGRHSVALPLLGLLCLAVWLAGTVLLPIGVPLFHLLLGVGATLLVVGWARRN